jgi:hypothetical protein
MRIVAASLIAAGLAGCAAKPPPAPPPAPQVVARPRPTFPAPTPAPICAKPAEKAALAVAALRMQLSVTELSCDAREQFNAFTVKFRNDVTAQNKTVNGFFNRAYGRGGQSSQDQYETAQINQMSEAGTYYGVDFCKTAMPMFTDVLALHNGSELADYAVKQNFDQVIAVDECPAQAAPSPKPASKPAPAKKSS